jgi:hypothetical protein
MRSDRIESVGGGAGRGVGRGIGRAVIKVKEKVVSKKPSAAEIQKIRTEQMQKRSVRVRPPSRTTKTGDTTFRESPYKQSNKDRAQIMKNIKSGKLAKDLEKTVVQSKPAKVVKINSSIKSTPKKKK